jgi:hypothetical protein
MVRFDGVTTATNTSLRFPPSCLLLPSLSPPTMSPPTVQYCVHSFSYLSSPHLLAGFIVQPHHPATAVAGVLPSTVAGRRRTFKRRSSCDACKEVTGMPVSYYRSHIHSLRSSIMAQATSCLSTEDKLLLPRIRQVCHPVRSGCRRGQAATAAISSGMSHCSFWLSTDPRCTTAVDFNMM